MAKYIAPEVKDISSSLSLEDTIRALADSALTGLEHYAKLKGAENRFDVNVNLKSLNASVKDLKWTTSTPEDFENALTAVDNLISPESMKGLNNSTKETISSAATIYKSKIEKEQALRSQADVAEADLNILLNKLDSLGNSALGNSEYDTVEALEVLEQIRLAKQHNIKEISNYLDKQASEKLLQGNNELATRNLLQSIDMDSTKEGISLEVSSDLANYYKKAFDYLNMEQTSFDKETGMTTFNVKENDELATWNAWMLGDDPKTAKIEKGLFGTAKDAFDKYQTAQEEFSEDISQFDTGEIIGMVDEGINAKSLGSTEQITSKKIIDYYFSG